jgi:hypothetical protein
MRRRVVVILIFLLAGAVVNVAVAWGCALWSPFKLAPRQAGQEHVLEELDGWMREIVDEYPRRSFLFADVRTAAGYRLVWILDHEQKRFPGGGSSTTTGQFAYASSGWPLPCLDGRWGPLATRGAVRRPDRFRAIGLRAPRLVPWVPMWLGFTVNTLFYAAILWLLIPGPFALRRFVRRRRGLCPACAYPMGEAQVCTECGRQQVDSALRRRELRTSV